MNPERRRVGVLKAKRVLKIWERCGIRFEDEAMKRQIMQAMVHTRKRCGKSCCSSPRKWYGKTIQEIKADEDFRDQLDAA